MAQTGLFLARCRFDGRNKRMLFSELIQCTDGSMIEDLNTINQCYRHEIEHTIQDVHSCGGDLSIALVADSHLDNSVPATIENISAVDQAVHFDCCVHLGYFLAGEIGRRYAKASAAAAARAVPAHCFERTLLPGAGQSRRMQRAVFRRGSGRRPSAFWTRSRASAVRRRSPITM